MTPAQPRSSASDHPATWRFDYPIYHVETRPQWRSWLEHRHRPTKVPLPRSRRRSDLLRVDRFDRHPPRRPPWPAIDHPPQSQELLEPTQPPTRRRHGKARPHDRRRTSCDRRGEGERMVDHLRPSRRPRRTHRPHHSTRPKRAGTSQLGQLHSKRSQTDALVDHQRQPRHHPRQPNHPRRSRRDARTTRPRLTAQTNTSPLR